MNKKVKGYLLFLVETAIFIGLLYAFAFPYMVDGSSMEDSYFTGDRVFISHISAWTQSITRGDAVVCDLADMRVIKRVIALPGDRLEIKDGRVYINGTLLDEDYISPDTYTSGDMDITVGSDEIFVMGDNRGVSLDSRKEGCIKYKDIKGKVIFKL